ncbi:MAG: AAA family ATPase, partial [Paraclostridium sp.]
MMRLNKIYIQNFKSFESITIHFNKSLNIFTGVNNSGKTTALEAIALWWECFDLLIKQSQKTLKNINKGEYRLGDTKPSFIDYREIISVRGPNFEDIFLNLDTNREIVIRSTISNNNEDMDIGFVIRKGNGGSNYKISLENYKDFDLKFFNRFFSKFPNPINAIYASP